MTTNIMKEKIINRLDEILDGEIKKGEGCKMIVDGKKCVSTKYLYYCLDINKAELISLLDSKKVEIIGKPITKHLTESAMNKIGIMNYPKDRGLMINAYWDYNLPDDLIEQCKNNTELEQFTCGVFGIE